MTNLNPTQTGCFALALAIFGCCSAAMAGAAPSAPYQSFRIKTDNIPQATIAGWILPARSPRPRGTIFFCHGYNNSKEHMLRFEWMRDEGWNLVMFDFREHGESTRTASLSSLGYHEIWDVKAVVDYAEAKHLSQPYCIYGRSMGASVGLRFAAQDKRIVGVFACSPFRDAYSASREATSMKTHVAWPASPFVVHRGFAQMLKEVDIPKAVAKRSDLRIWIIAGQFDCFPASDQDAILSASKSPPTYKHLLIAPGKDHHDTFMWKGDWRLPSHDNYVRQFLRDCAGKPSTIMTWVPGTSVTIPLNEASPMIVPAGLMVVVLSTRKSFRRRAFRWIPFRRKVAAANS